MENAAYCIPLRQEAPGVVERKPEKQAFEIRVMRFTPPDFLPFPFAPLAGTVGEATTFVGWPDPDGDVS